MVRKDPKDFREMPAVNCMSNKEAVINSVRQLPDDVSLDEILRSLQSEYGAPPSIPEWDSDEVTDDEWRLFVAQGLRDELNDPREDIYGSEDGEPIDGQG